MTKEFNPVFLSLSIIEMDDILRTPYLKQTCLRLSHGRGFGMTRSIECYERLIQERSVDATGIFAFYQGKPVGWLLYTYETDCVSFRPWERDNSNEAAAHIFVAEEWRRLGIGTRLLQMAAKMAEPDTLRVYAHENQSFFQPIIKQFDSLQAI